MHAMYNNDDTIAVNCGIQLAHTQACGADWARSKAFGQRCLSCFGRIYRDGQMGRDNVRDTETETETETDIQSTRIAPAIRCLKHSHVEQMTPNESFLTWNDETERTHGAHNRPSVSV